MDHGLETFTEYLIEALKACQGWTYSDILRALGVVLYENGGRLSQVGKISWHHAYSVTRLLFST